MHYCGVQCQRSDWKIHKIECNRFSSLSIGNNLDIINDDLIRVYYRILIKYFVFKLNIFIFFKLKT